MLLCGIQNCGAKREHLWTFGGLIRQMITDCFGARQWDLALTEAIFVQGVFALVKILIPVAISVYTLKVCQTGRAHQRTSLLGLKETTSHQETNRE